MQNIQDYLACEAELYNAVGAQITSHGLISKNVGLLQKNLIISKTTSDAEH